MSDLISRQAALDIVFDFAEAPHNMYQKIRELPTIEPKMVVEDYCRPRNLMVVAAEYLHQLEKPKHGKWVDVMTEEWCTFDECKCSVCGVVEYFNKGWKKFSYCPNCGARMERSEDAQKTD